MKMYYENVEDYLAEYGTLTKTVIFSKDGEKLFSVPDDVEFAQPHFLAVVRCMADSLHPLAGIIVGDIVYKCLRVDNSLLVGRSDTEEFVAYKSQDIVIVGFSDREKSGDCCLTDVKNLERELYRGPDIEQEGEEVMLPEEEEQRLTPQETILQSTEAKPQQSKPRVMFSDGNSPTRHVKSARQLPRTNLPGGPDKDLDVVNEAFESSLDDEDASFERIEIDEAATVVPQAAPEQVELRDLS